METTKLPTLDYEFEGRTYRLMCNMNVIADVQDAYNGNLMAALRARHGLKSTLAFLAAMLTEAADTQDMTDDSGLPLRFTGKELGRRFSMRQTLDVGEKIWPLIEAAVRPAEPEDGAAEDKKN